MDKIQTPIYVREGIRMELVSQDHEQMLLSTVLRNKEFLADSCPWVEDFEGLDSSKEFIQFFVDGSKTNRQFCFAIILRATEDSNKETEKTNTETQETESFTEKQKDVLLGMMSLQMMKSIKSGEIGYWLDKEHNGKGIIHSCAVELLRVVFEQLQLKVLSLQCQQSNEKSSNVAKRLGFVFSKSIEEPVVINNKEWILDEYWMTKKQYFERKGVDLSKQKQTVELEQLQSTCLTSLSDLTII